MANEIKKLQKQAEQLFEQKKFKEIIALLKDDLLEKTKDAQLYAWRARAGYRLDEDVDKMLLYAQKAIDADSNYFMAYHVRGSTWDEKGEHDKAIADYTKAIKLNPDFEAAYYNRGIAWDAKGKNDKAIADYTKALQLKPDDVNTYLNRGNSWYDKGEYDKAIVDYNKAIEVKPDDAGAYYNIAIVYDRIADYNKAMTNFEKAIELNHRIKDAKWMINSINEKQDARLNKETDDVIKKIKTILNIIRKISRSEDSLIQVVHYSKLSVADIVTNDCHSCMHYSNAIYMNDPEEGITFLNYLGDDVIQKWFDIQSRKNESIIFLGSFLPLQEEGKNTNDTLGSSEDQLLMWRTYGKNEEGIDAAGCNFVINTSFFKEDEARAATHLPGTFAEIKKAIESGVKLVDEREDANALLKVQYIKNSKKILNDPGDLLSQLIDYFKVEIRKLIEEHDNSSTDISAKIYTDKSIYNAIQELSHLFKSSDYSFENEVRVIRSEPRNSSNIQYYKSLDGKEPRSPKHFYVRSGNRILPYLDKIFLGPKVKDSRHWSLHFDYSLRKVAKTEKEELERILLLGTKTDNSDNEKKELEGLKKLYNYNKDISTVKKIEPDQIEIIPSKCRFT